VGSLKESNIGDEVVQFKKKKTIRNDKLRMLKKLDKKGSVIL